MVDDTIEVQPREVTGKRVSRLRRQGVLPANVYGRHLQSVAVQLPTTQAADVLKVHGLNNLLSLRVAGEAESRPVVVRRVQRHPASRELQHVDFYQVDLTRTIQAAVPVHIVGEAPAVQLHGGVLLQGADSVMIEALPAAVPGHLEVSVDGLDELDATVTLADIELPEGVRLLSAGDTMLARIARPRLVAEEEEEGALAEGEEALAAAPAAEEGAGEAAE